MAKTQLRKTEYLLKNEEKRAYKRLLLSAAVVIFFIITFAMWGFQILAKFAEFLDLIRNTANPPAVSQDTIAPAPPRLYPLPNATNSANLTISGYAEAGSTVEIIINSQSISKTLADNNGNFKFENLTIKEGNNRIEARAIDKAGNQSSLTEPAIVILDKTPPTLEVNYPPDNVTFSSDKREVVVSGATEENATVTVNGFWAITDQEGNFSYNLILNNGENKITVEAADAAGNKKQITRVVYLY